MSGYVDTELRLSRVRGAVEPVLAHLFHALYDGGLMRLLRDPAAPDAIRPQISAIRATDSRLEEPEREQVAPPSRYEDLAEIAVRHGGLAIEGELCAGGSFYTAELYLVREQGGGGGPDRGVPWSPVQPSEEPIFVKLVLGSDLTTALYQGDELLRSAHVDQALKNELLQRFVQIAEACGAAAFAYTWASQRLMPFDPGDLARYLRDPRGAGEGWAGGSAYGISTKILSPRELAGVWGGFRHVKESAAGYTILDLLVEPG